MADGSWYLFVNSLVLLVYPVHSRTPPEAWEKAPRGSHADTVETGCLEWHGSGPRDRAGHWQRQLGTSGSLVQVSCYSLRPHPLWCVWVCRPMSLKLQNAWKSLGRLVNKEDSRPSLTEILTHCRGWSPGISIINKYPRWCWPTWSMDHTVRKKPGISMYYVENWGTRQRPCNTVKRSRSLGQDILGCESWLRSLEKCHKVFVFVSLPIKWRWKH